MFAFLIGVLVLWIVWRCLARSIPDVVIAPPAAPPMTVNVLIPSVVIHVHVKRTEHGRDVV